MLTSTNYSVPVHLLDIAKQQIPSDDFKLTINKPTGRFFYDPWVLIPEFKNTVWETLYNSLPVDKGEARIINLNAATCYRSHSDIDDRYHLNIVGENSYLINLDSEEMHRIERDGAWYELDTGPRHTAANFGRFIRVQLVIRKLLNQPTLIKPIKISITPVSAKDDTRFIFDDVISPWLNIANKNNFINNFNFTQFNVTFDMEELALASLKDCLTNEFNLEILV